jgi:hypothetical protein
VATDHIAAGINVLLGGLEVLIHFVSTVGNLTPARFRARPSTAGRLPTATSSAWLSMSSPRSVTITHEFFVAHAHDVCSTPDSDSLLFEDLTESRGCLRVRNRERTVRALKDGDPEPNRPKA